MVHPSRGVLPNHLVRVTEPPSNIQHFLYGPLIPTSFGFSTQFDTHTYVKLSLYCDKVMSFCTLEYFTARLGRGFGSLEVNARDVKLYSRLSFR